MIRLHSRHEKGCLHPLAAASGFYIFAYIRNFLKAKFDAMAENTRPNPILEDFRLPEKNFHYFSEIPVVVY